MIIAIDFDGTIVKDEYPAIGELISGAKETINQFYKDGHHIIIWTCRAEKALRDAVDFLNENGIMFHSANESHPGNVQEYGGLDTRKIYADVYIDDKSLIFIQNWSFIQQKVNVLCSKQNTQ
jgi:hydroxymethylpyrimidine pyrophosphatase-like HAD family hydrolase